MQEELRATARQVRLKEDASERVGESEGQSPSEY